MAQQLVRITLLNLDSVMGSFPFKLLQLSFSFFRLIRLPIPSLKGPRRLFFSRLSSVKFDMSAKVGGSGPVGLCGQDLRRAYRWAQLRIG